MNAPQGQPDTGTVEAAVANLPNRISDAGFARSMDNLTAAQPDFLMLNEVSRHSIDTIEALAPGYDAYRDPVTDSGVGGSQSLNNVVLWSAARWTLVDAGRVKLVDNDMGYDAKGDAYTWDRYATWATLQGADGGIVSVVWAHMMTNPAYYPRQPRRSAETRIERYSRGMDVLRATTSVLGQYGPVLVGGDMNSHPGQGAWTAAAKLGSLGFRYAKDTGVMYLFYPGAEQAREQSADPRRLRPPGPRRHAALGLTALGLRAASCDQGSRAGPRGWSMLRDAPVPHHAPTPCPTRRAGNSHGELWC